MSSLSVYRRRDYRVKCARCRRWMRKRPTVKTPVARARPPHAGLCVGCAPPVLNAFRPVSQPQVTALNTKCSVLQTRSLEPRELWKARVKRAAAAEFGIPADVSFKDLTYEQAHWCLDWLGDRELEHAA